MSNTEPFSIVEKLIALKLLEDKIKELREELKGNLPETSSISCEYGKVTKTVQSRITVDGAVAYDLLVKQGIDPTLYGACSVKLDERTISRLVSLGYLTEDVVTDIVKSSEYEVLRVTPNPDTTPMLLLATKHNFNRLLLESNND